MFMASDISGVIELADGKYERGTTVTIEKSSHSKGQELAVVEPLAPSIRNISSRLDTQR
jgi:hypothetical protein